MMQFSIDKDGNITINNKLLMYDVFTDTHQSFDELLPGEKLYFKRMKMLMMTKEAKQDIAKSYKEMLVKQMQAVTEQNYEDKADLLGFYQNKIAKIQEVITNYERD